MRLINLRVPATFVGLVFLAGTVPALAQIGSGGGQVPSQDPTPCASNPSERTCDGKDPRSVACGGFQMGFANFNNCTPFI